MNAIEIEQAISELAEQAFDAEEFPFQFLEAFGNPATTIKRLRSGNTNKSDVDGAVLQRSNIHLSVVPVGEVGSALIALRESPQTEKQKAQFILATDGVDLEAEDLSSGETVACAPNRLSSASEQAASSLRNRSCTITKETHLHEKRATGT